MDQNGGGIGFVTINLGFGTIFDFFHILQFERRTWPIPTHLANVTYSGNSVEGD